MAEYPNAINQPYNPPSSPKAGERAECHDSPPQQQPPFFHSEGEGRQRGDTHNLSRNPAPCPLCMCVERL